MYVRGLEHLRYKEIYIYLILVRRSIRNRSLLYEIFTHVYMYIYTHDT